MFSLTKVTAILSFILLLTGEIAAQESRDQCLQVAEIEGYVMSATSAPLNRAYGNLFAYQVGNEVKIVRVTHNPEVATYANDFAAQLETIATIPVPTGLKTNLTFAGSKLAIAFEAVGQSSATQFVNSGDLARIIVYDTATGSYVGGSGQSVPFEPNARTNNGIYFYPRPAWAFRNWQSQYCSGQASGQLGQTVAGFADGRLVVGNWIQYATMLGPEYTSQGESFCNPPLYRRYSNGSLVQLFDGLRWNPVPFTAPQAWPLWGMSNPGFKIIQPTEAGPVTLKNAALPTNLPDEERMGIGYHRIYSVSNPAVDAASGAFALPINFGVEYYDQDNYGGVYLFDSAGNYVTFYSRREPQSYTAYDGAVTSIGRRPYDVAPRYAVASPGGVLGSSTASTGPRGQLEIVSSDGQLENEYIGRSMGDLFGRSIAALDQYEDGFNEILAGAPNGIGANDVRTGYIAVVDTRLEEYKYAYVLTPPSTEVNFGRIVAAVAGGPERAASLGLVVSDSKARLYDFSTCLTPAQRVLAYMAQDAQIRVVLFELDRYRERTLRSTKTPSRSYQLSHGLALGLTFIEEAPYAKHFTLAFRSDEQFRHVSEAVAPNLQKFRAAVARLEKLRKLIPNYRRRGQEDKLRRAKAEFRKLVKQARALCRQIYGTVHTLATPIAAGSSGSAPRRTGRSPLLW